MAQEDAFEAEALPARRHGVRRWVLLAGALVLAMFALAWLSREEIAGNLITAQLQKRGIPATYRIVRIGPDRQVFADVAIGDPARPDLTVERLEVETMTRWGVPGIGRITLVRPRLHAMWRDGKAHFGALDPLVYTGSEEPAALPDLDIAVRDGRARFDGPMGPAGFKLEGQGNLADGFAGTVAAIAPAASFGGCTAQGASAYGKLSSKAGSLRFAGPLRLTRLDCADAGLQLGKTGMETEVTFAQHFDAAVASGSLAASGLAAGQNRMAGAGGTLRLSWREKSTVVLFDLAGKGIETPGAALAGLSLKGAARASDGLSRFSVEGEADGKGLRAGDGLDAALERAERAGAGSMVAPIARQVRLALRREAAGSGLAAHFILRRTGGIANLVVPQARVTGGSGSALLTLSRLGATFGGTGSPRLSGSFATGGPGLPHIEGRLERTPGGGLATRLALAEYRAGTARVALPHLFLVQRADGALGFAGQALLSGDLPGGRAEGLQLPLEGNYSAAGGLALWRGCVPVRFRSLALASLALDSRQVTLCPPPGGAIVRAGAGGLRIAAGAPSLLLTGRLGGSPVRIASGPFGMAWPGAFAARQVDVALGPADAPARFVIGSLKARLAANATGSFSNTTAGLAAVPLDLADASGEWRYANGALDISAAAFRLTDREADARFQPLVARDAALRLADGVITAGALLREPASDRAVLRADIVHRLDSGSGNARLAVDDLRFDKGLQPDTLSRMALGVIANAEGAVRGSGLVEWTPAGVTSRGRFATDSLDFAAAFGPVQGLSGAVEFTDLLGLVTAPDQRLRIASINPGIPAENGTLSFEMHPGHVLVVNGARWPFLDGSLMLEPTRMVLGAAEVRRYTLAIEGLDAAKFVQHLQLSNLSATGVFDGRLPLVFDENGGRIEGGQLASRPPGGNVSYLGELSYKDLSAMGNFAFDALRSIDYRSMQIEMNGALTGEIITRVKFDGLSQGAGARRNVLTRQVAKLPIRFNVNVRAPFFSLFGSFKSLYDPSLVADPTLIGLAGGKTGVQPPASEKMP